MTENRPIAAALDVRLREDSRPWERDSPDSRLTVLAETFRIEESVGLFRRGMIGASFADALLRGRWSSQKRKLKSMPISSTSKPFPRGSSMNQTEVVESKLRRFLGNVLVATDFSRGGARAVARAARLPIAPGSAIIILHVLTGAAQAKTEAATRRALEQAASAARKAIRDAGRSDVDVFTHIARGKPFVEIIDHARHTRAHLIVVGRHGQRPFRDLLLGSTAERVIRKGATPVLIVDSRGTGPYRRPLVAVDGSETSCRAFELALQIVGSVDSIDVVHAYGTLYESGMRRTGIRESELQEYGLETGKAARAMLDAFLATYKAEGRVFSIALRRGDPRVAILRVAAQRQSDLLALGTHGRSGLAHVLIGSVAEAVVRAAPCDVLVARPLRLAFTLP